MSRVYKLYVAATGISKEQLDEVIQNEYGWKGETEPCNKAVIFYGEGYLCAGQSEEEAHIEFSKSIKKINPKAKIKTYWTYLYLEDLPFEAYGDDIHYS